MLKKVIITSQLEVFSISIDWYLGIVYKINGVRKLAASEVVDDEDVEPDQ